MYIGQLIGLLYVQVLFEPSAVFLFGSDTSQTWIDFFSTVGGLMGICISVSVVTCVELFWLVLQLGRKAINDAPKNGRRKKMNI